MGVEDKIESFANLPQGWDYGAGGPIPKKTRDAALEWNNLLKFHGFGDTDAFAGGSREIVIALTSGDHYLEVIVEPDDSVSVAYDYQRKQMFYRPKLSDLEAQLAIQEVVRRIWSASGYFTLTSIILGNANLRGQLLGMSMAGYPSSSGPASLPPGTPPQIIYGTTISAFQEWSVIPRSSGDLTPPFFPYPIQ
jgi:hypothetical protein